LTPTLATPTQVPLAETRQVIQFVGEILTQAREVTCAECRLGQIIAVSTCAVCFERRNEELHNLRVELIRLQEEHLRTQNQLAELRQADTVPTTTAVSEAPPVPEVQAVLLGPPIQSYTARRTPFPGYGSPSPDTDGDVVLFPRTDSPTDYSLTGPVGDGNEADVEDNQTGSTC
jgi:hypothetical protein